MYMTTFPKNIFFYWDYSTSIPRQFIDNINSFKNNYNDFTIEIINDDKINSISELDSIFPNLLMLYNKLNIYAAKSDLARLVYLYFYGGIYLDTHIEHIFKYDGNNFYKLFNKYELFDFVIARDDSGTFNCSSIISKPRCNLLHDVIKNINCNLNNHYNLEKTSDLHIKYDILSLTGSANFYIFLEFYKLTNEMNKSDIINSEKFKNYNTAFFSYTNYLNYYKVYYEFNHENAKHWSEQQKVKRLFTD